MEEIRTRVLIIGSGIAGLSVALKLADRFRVTVICKSEKMEGATRYAQGGIASVWSQEDSFEEHLKDTTEAGAGICHPDIVDLCVRTGPARVKELIEIGVPFTKKSDLSSDPIDLFDLHREGGHQRRRILHADDTTGLAIEQTLIEAVAKHPNIEILEHHIAIDLISDGKRAAGRCYGAYVLDVCSGSVRTIASEVTVLACGGAGKAYLYTSNPDTATGDGIALAYRVGARVANLEFIQFHPTCLYHPEAKNFLVSEALRGEGAVLKNLAGVEFMKKHHPLGSLAPRDVVARAIDIEIKRTGDRYVLLDARDLTKTVLQEKFPNIYEQCLKFGIDIAEDPIPVVPAVHYVCGGVLVDSNGLTSVDRLYAVGETACTGLHGANRLASNSLLEAVVFADQVSKHVIEVLAHSKDSSLAIPALPKWETGFAVELEEKIDLAAIWLEIRNLMWNYVGIVRTNRRLEKAKRRLDLLRAEVNESYWDYLLTKDLIELRNLVTVASLILECALWRKESRGLHYTMDYPEKNERFYSRDTVI